MKIKVICVSEFEVRPLQGNLSYILLFIKILIVSYNTIFSNLTAKNNSLTT